MSRKVQGRSRARLGHWGLKYRLGLLPPPFWGHPPPFLEGEQYGLSLVLVRFLTEVLWAGATLYRPGHVVGGGAGEVPGPRPAPPHNAQR